MSVTVNPPDASALVSVDVVVEAPGWLPTGAEAGGEEDLDATAARLEPFVGHVIATAARMAPGSAGENVALAVAFCDDAAVRVLNRSYRGKDSATNVLSFPAPAAAVELDGPRFVGDVVLARETVEREAAAAGRSVESHAAHLVVHGFLHLLGYDHEEEEEARQMEGLEIAVLAALGIPDPYDDPRSSAEG